MRRRRTPPAVRALVLQLRPGRSVSAIVGALAELGHQASRSAVGRIIGPKSKAPRRPVKSRAKSCSAKLAGAALRWAGDREAALAALDAARLELAANP